jgi:hypothetical protein
VRRCRAEASGRCAAVWPRRPGGAPLSGRGVRAVRRCRVEASGRGAAIWTGRPGGVPLSGRQRNRRAGGRPAPGGRHGDRYRGSLTRFSVGTLPAGRHDDRTGPNALSGRQRPRRGSSRHGHAPARHATATPRLVTPRPRPGRAAVTPATTPAARLDPLGGATRQVEDAWCHRPPPGRAIVRTSDTARLRRHLASRHVAVSQPRVIASWGRPLTRGRAAGRCPGIRYLPDCGNGSTSGPCGRQLRHDPKRCG